MLVVGVRVGVLRGGGGGGGGEGEGMTVIQAK